MEKLSNLIVPESYYFHGRVSSKRDIRHIKEKFKKMDLLRRIKETQFEYVFHAPYLQFSGSIFHEVLIRKSTKRIPNKISFLINNQEVCFGIEDYAMITGLDFGPFPDVQYSDEWKSDIQERYFPDKFAKKKTRVWVSELKSAFDSCDIVEDALKLGLVALVCEYFFSSEKKSPIDNKLFNLVDDIDAFINYPWGKVTWIDVMKGMKMDLKGIADSLYPKGGRKDGDKVKSKPYTLHGPAIAIQIWAYEIIPSLASRFATKLPARSNTPKIMLYTSEQKPIWRTMNEVFNTAEVLPKMEVSAELRELYEDVNFEDFERNSFTGFNSIYIEKAMEDDINQKEEDNAKKVQSSNVDKCEPLLTYVRRAKKFNNPCSVLNPNNATSNNLEKEVFELKATQASHYIELKKENTYLSKKMDKVIQLLMNPKKVEGSRSSIEIMDSKDCDIEDDYGDIGNGFSLKKENDVEGKVGPGDATRDSAMDDQLKKNNDVEGKDGSGDATRDSALDDQVQNIDNSEDKLKGQYDGPSFSLGLTQLMNDQSVIEKLDDEKEVPSFSMGLTQVPNHESVAAEHQSSDEIMTSVQELITILEAPEVGELVTRKRKRKPPSHLSGFTDFPLTMKVGKQIPNVEGDKIIDPIDVDPLADYDHSLYDQILSLIDGKMQKLRKSDRRDTWDVKTPFNMSKLVTKNNWLDDIHIDGALDNIRQRVFLYPQTYAKYGKSISIANCHFSTLFEKQYKKFKENPNGFKFGKQFLKYYEGNEGTRMQPWQKSDEVFFPLNVKGKHWVLCIFNVKEWCIKVYDCDRDFVKDGYFGDKICPLVEMIPYLLKQVTPADSKAECPNHRLEKLLWERLSHDIVPKTKISGNCGMFVIMYIEYIIAGLEVAAVVDDHMLFWRKKWAVRLYHNVFRP